MIASSVRDGRRAPAAYAFALLASISCVGCIDPVHVEHEWVALDRPARAELYLATQQDADLAIEDIVRHVEEVRATMGYGVPGSELTRLNDGASEGYYSIEDRDLYRLVKLALDYAQVSRGSFDPSLAPLERLYSREGGRVPTETEVELTLGRVGWNRVVVATEARAIHFRAPGMELDLGGILPGFALDVASRAFARPGSLGGRLSLGTTHYVWDPPPGQETWQQVLEDPRDPGRTLGTVELVNRGVSIQGHPEGVVSDILDGRVGRPASSDLLVAVGFANSAADAQALTTAMFVSGSALSGDLVARMNRVEALLLVEGEGQPYALASATLQGRFTPSPEFETETGGRIRYILAPQTLDVDRLNLLGS